MTPSTSRAHPLQRLLAYARAYRRDMGVATLYSILNKLFDVLPEILIGVAVDIVVNGEKSFLARRLLAEYGFGDTWSQLLVLGFFNILIWIGESVFQYLYDVRWRTLAQHLQHAMRMDVYAHIQQLDMQYFENQRTGNLMSILNDDINQMERFLNGGANDIIQVLFSTLIVSAVFFALQPMLAAIALAPVPLILFGAFWFQGRLAPRYAAVRQAAGDVSARLNNNLLGLATIKAYTSEAQEAAHVAEASLEYQRRNGAAIRWSAAITPVIRMAILLGFTATLVVGGWLTIQGELAVGAYSMLVFLTQRLLWPLTRLAETADLYQRSMAAINRALDLLDTPIGITGGGRALPAGEVRGEIRFADIGFSYGDVPLLQGLSVKVGAGETAAFVGATGSGKSTLVKLLLRFYEPQGGRILLDGQPIGELDLQDLRRAIGYVAQDAFMTDGTVGENIAYGTPGASEAAIRQAAEQAGAMEFIAGMPAGLATRIGERGQKLSGGQRQRLALARAILRDPRILILDEATSAVDNETEAAILESLAVVSRHRTTLVIAHRLSTVRHAHCIHVLAHGRIVETGTHDSLLAQNGSYAALWRLQTGERFTAPVCETAAPDFLSA